MHYRIGLGLLAVTALLSTTLPATAALPPRPAETDWPVVGRALQYLAGPDSFPQAALITSVPRPAAPGKATTFPVVQVQVFPPAAPAFAATVGYCSETSYPCLVPLP